MLKIYRNKKDLQLEIKHIKYQGKQIGFVPTMGALHKGHLSLMKACKARGDVLVVSIFVNPTQFNEEEDYRCYPRSEEADIQTLKRINCDLLFLPGEKEMYPNGRETLSDFDPGEVGKHFEGENRPGHFQGVATIVKKLFDIIQPHNAYFGEKDFQQYLIIKRLTEQYNMDINIIPCPAVREKDGLAISSRNLLLKSQERKKAAVIYKTLTRAKVKLQVQSPQEVKEWAWNYLKDYPEFQPEYFEILNAKNLKSFDRKENVKKIVIITAVRIGKVRLIDNLIIRK